MFFVTRSALCIGVVVALAATAPGREGVGTSLEREGRVAATDLGLSCLASMACANAGMRIVSAVTGQDGPLLATALRGGTTTPAGLPAVADADERSAAARHPSPPTPRRRHRGVAARE